MHSIHNEKCGIRKAMALIGSKWKMVLIGCLKHGVQRYGELKRLIPDISEKMLIQELKDLVEAGLVEKKAYPEIPPRVEYRLTEKGMKAVPVLEMVETFGREYL